MPNNKTLGPIRTLEDLKYYLRIAIQLEHATIPPYLTALYSIEPGTNRDAYDLLRVVSVEEMLHLTLSANMLNAIGETPDLTTDGFVPEYPTYLPSGETDFQVSLERFSKQAIDTFMNIERPSELPEDHVSSISTKGLSFALPKGLISTARSAGSLLPSFYNEELGETYEYYSIGDFYKAIEDGFEKLEKEAREAGKSIFLSKEKNTNQITPEYYYSGGGDIIPVYELEDAKEAIRLISEQGEGFKGSIYDHEGELSHYYRFEQIDIGKYYHKGDEAGKPTGEPLQINYDAVYPIKTNAKMTDYPAGSELYHMAEGFNQFYGEFLKQLTEAFGGNPRLLLQAVGGMFRIKDLCYSLMRNPIPEKDGVHGAPTFQIG